MTDEITKLLNTCFFFFYLHRFTFKAPTSFFLIPSSLHLLSHVCFFIFISCLCTSTFLFSFFPPCLSFSWCLIVPLSLAETGVWGKAELSLFILPARSLCSVFCCLWMQQHGTDAAVGCFLHPQQHHRCNTLRRAGLTVECVFCVQNGVCVGETERK